MAKRLSSFIIFLIVASTSYAQNTTPVKDKQVIARYGGGEIGLVEHHITLYSDSSFLYLGWDDTSPNSRSSKGTFRRTDSTIVLYSQDTILNKDNKTKEVISDSSEYRMKNNTILFYSKEDEKNYPYVSEFRTLCPDKIDK